MGAEIMDSSSLVVGAGWFENLGFSRTVVAVGTDTVKFEADACGAGPCISGCRITLDFPPSASFTGPHD